MSFTHWHLVEKSSGQAVYRVCGSAATTLVACAGDVGCTLRGGEAGLRIPVSINGELMDEEILV